MRSGKNAKDASDTGGSSCQFVGDSPPIHSRFIAVCSHGAVRGSSYEGKPRRQLPHGDKNVPRGGDIAIPCYSALELKEDAQQMPELPSGTVTFLFTACRRVHQAVGTLPASYGGIHGTPRRALAWRDGVQRWLCVQDHWRRLLRGVPFRAPRPGGGARRPTGAPL